MSLNGEANTLARKINASTPGQRQLAETHDNEVHQNLKQLLRIYEVVVGRQMPAGNDPGDISAPKLDGAESGKPTVISIMENTTYGIANTKYLLEALGKELGVPVSQRENVDSATAQDRNLKTAGEHY